MRPKGKSSLEEVVSSDDRESVTAIKKAEQGTSTDLDGCMDATVGSNRGWHVMQRKIELAGKVMPVLGRPVRCCQCDITTVHMNSLCQHVR